MNIVQRLILLVLLSSLMVRPGFADNIKSPNVSGQFYDSDPGNLARDVEAYIKNADNEPSTDDVRMIIAPHAGYVFSGPVAGYSFKAVSKKKFKTIVILAPSHFYGFDGASVWPEGGFKTPLGVVPVDAEFAKKLSAADPHFSFVPDAYNREHALEVEIPFLQETFKDFKIVPVILGQMSLETCEKLAAVLNRMIGDRKDILIVVSSDMSHYHDGQFARRMDLGTLELIKGMDAANFYKQCRVGLHEMCGFIPVTTALLYAQLQNLEPAVLKYAHSGDVTGDNSRVVGYGSVIFSKTKNKVMSPEIRARKSGGVEPLNKEQKRQLMAIAKQTIDHFVRENKVFEVKVSDPRFNVTEGAFVTIHKDGRLRGCIGHIVTDEPLSKTISEMAVAAASEDPRFPPVRPEELKDLDLEISVLSKPWRITNVSEIEMGKHGVIVSQGFGRQGVFLPQVATETGWSKEEFLSQLCSQKAGLNPNCWKDPSTTIEIFTADVFSEKELQ